VSNVVSIAEALQVGIQHHSQGNLAEAEQIYRKVLEADPNSAGAWHLLGVIAHQVGQQQVALEYITRAIELLPTDPGFHSNLGEVFRALGRHNEALVCYNKAIELQPNHAEAYSNMGNVLDELNRFDEARQALERALQIRPNYPAALSNLGNVYKGLRDPVAAEKSYREAIRIDPNFAQAHNNLGSLIEGRGDIPGAEICFREAVRATPGFAEAWYNLGGVLKRTGRYVMAVQAFRQALATRPVYAEAHNNVGVTLKELGQHDQALFHCRTATQQRANYVEAINNVAVITEELGMLDESLANYRAALTLRPDYMEIRSGWLLALNYDGRLDPDTIAQEHHIWGKMYVPRFPPAPYKNTRDPDRRIKLAYVSPDFRRHPVGNFIEPSLESHNREQFEITLFSDVEARDVVTDRLEKLSERWVNVANDSYDDVYRKVRELEIDILVELAGHTARNRLPTLLQRAAPIQVTYLGYPNTIGIPQIDYLITDAIVDPPGEERLFTENLIRVDGCFSCYRPRDDAPAVMPSPALEKGVVTFGSLHSLSKFTPPVIDLWCRVLHAVPNSKMLMFRTTLVNETAERVRGEFAKRGIDPARIDLRGHVPPAGYLTTYYDIDITLDVIPWTGHTTACESMWMGVPVVTHLGNRHAGRMVASVLHAVGHPEWIGNTLDEYVEIAARMAADVSSLANSRLKLRDEMAASKLCDGPAFTRQLEAVYRQMWRTWCEKESG
jgi:predicted O-linked N-acetylglucosamine transferase (SPINDLY family)